MDFEDFCAAATSTYQLEALDKWEQIASTAFEYFEQEGNRVISVEELARVSTFMALPVLYSSVILFDLYIDILIKEVLSLCFIYAGVECGPHCSFCAQRLDKE